MTRAPHAALLAAVLCLPPACAAGQGSVLEEAGRAARESGLLGAGCPSWEGGGLPLWYSYRPEGGARTAETALLLPVPAGELAGVLEDFASYPQWVLPAPDGSPNVEEVSFDPGTGRGRVVVQGEGIEGVLVREAEGKAAALRIRMLGGKHIRDVRLEAAALPLPRCEGASIAVLRIGWGFSLRARFLAGEIAKSVPALFLLAIRDDLAARILRDRERTAQVLGAPLRREAGGRFLTAAPPGGGGAGDWPAAGEAVLRLEPAAVWAHDAAVSGIARLVEKVRAGAKVGPEEWFLAFFEAMSGSRRYGGYRMSVDREAGPASFLVAPEAGSVEYEVRLERGSLTARFGAVEGASTRQ